MFARTCFFCRSFWLLGKKKTAISNVPRSNVFFSSARMPCQFWKFFKTGLIAVFHGFVDRSKNEFHAVLSNASCEIVLETYCDHQMQIQNPWHVTTIVAMIVHSSSWKLCSFWQGDGRLLKVFSLCGNS